MLDQLRHFQAIVECGSFTEAAEQCHISQSALSQQIQSLEMELGVKLLNRDKRKISLTEAGEHFYRKSLILVADYERLIRETLKIANGKDIALKIGVLLSYGGEELQKAVSVFSRKYPDINIKIETDNHEALREKLLQEELDILLSDQRRAFFNSANNVIVQRNQCYIEIAKDNPISKLEKVTSNDLRNTPCILICNKGQEFEEKQYYQTTFNIEGEFLYANSLKEARLMVVSNQGYIPIDGQPVLSHFSQTIERVPFYVKDTQFERNLCIFWEKDNSGYLIEDFAEILESEFHKNKKIEG